MSKRTRALAVWQASTEDALAVHSRENAILRLIVGLQADDPNSYSRAIGNISARIGLESVTWNRYEWEASAGDLRYVFKEALRLYEFRHNHDALARRLMSPMAVIRGHSRLFVRLIAYSDIVEAWADTELIGNDTYEVTDAIGGEFLSEDDAMAGFHATLREYVGDLAKLATNAPAEFWLLYWLRAQLRRDSSTSVPEGQVVRISDYVRDGCWTDPEGWMKLVSSNINRPTLDDFGLPRLTKAAELDALIDRALSEHSRLLGQQVIAQCDAGAPHTKDIDTVENLVFGHSY